MKKNQFFGLLVGLILVNCQETNVVEEMQHFDARFIPVWIAAKTGNTNNLQSAVTDLQNQWETLKSEYELEIGPTVDWLETYECLDDLMNQTTSALEREDMPSVLEYLDGIRFELIHLRNRYNVSYDLDKIWEFEMAYTLVKTMMQNPKQVLLELNELDCIVEDMNIAWEKVLKSNPIAMLPTEKKNIFKQFQQDIDAQLKTFNDEVAALNVESETVPDGILRIEQSLLGMLALFGGASQAEHKTVN